MLPLNWIYVDANRGTTADLFNFLRRNFDKLSSCTLLDVVFEAFWIEQQRLILRYCFFPFLAFFFTGQIYYLEFMLEDVMNLEEDAEKTFECGFFWRGSLDCSTWVVLEALFRWVLLVLNLHQTVIEGFHMKQ